MRSYVMKRIYLLLLLPLLVGCGQTAKSNNQELIPDSEPSSETSESEGSSESVISSEAESSSSEEEEEVETEECTITFRNGGFTTSTFEKDTTQSSFINWFNNHENANGLLTSIGYDNNNYYVQMNYIGNEGDANRFSTYILGSKNYAGKMTFNFSKVIKSITCTVQAYCKYIEYSQSYNIDYNSVFYINQASTDLSVAESYSGNTEEVEVSAKMEAGAKSFSLSSKDKNERVFVHQIKITYVVK